MMVTGIPVSPNAGAQGFELVKHTILCQLCNFKFITV